MLIIHDATLTCRAAINLARGAFLPRGVEGRGRRGREGEGGRGRGRNGGKRAHALHFHPTSAWTYQFHGRGNRTESDS